MPALGNLFQKLRRGGNVSQLMRPKLDNTKTKTKKPSRLTSLMNPEAKMLNKIQTESNNM